MRIGLAFHVLILVIPSRGFAQPPVIKSIVNMARGDVQLSPGVLAELRYQASTPFDIGFVAVRVSGQPVYVYDEETGGALLIRLPSDLPAGPASVVLETSVGNSEPFRVTLDAYAPGIFAPTPSPYFDF